ncbi:hypothetical protein BDV18DRAFT_109861 [Aspergillus unguis]
MSRIGSTEDEKRMTLVGRNIWSVKNRVWAGIVPMSEQRWAEKGLDRPSNFDLATQYLSAVVAGFEYLNQPQVVRNMRETFNLISEHWGQYEMMVNAAREADQERLDVRKLWTEYIAALFEVITERAHHWVVSHVDALREPLLQQIGEHHGVNPLEPDRLQWQITNRLHVLMEISSRADFTIILPMAGYHGYTAPSIPQGLPAGLFSPDWSTRKGTYMPYLKRVTTAVQLEDMMSNTGQSPRQHFADPSSLQNTCMIQIRAQRQIRDQMRGVPADLASPGPQEPWIRDTIRNMEFEENEIKASGLVVYRLTYGQTEAEWTAFRQKIDAHISNWGGGHTGSEDLKPYLKLHWRDGQALGIAEGDIEAAKKHYNDTQSDSTDLPFAYNDIINDNAFLIIDQPSYDSYMTPSYSAATSAVLPGDFTGFLLAIDPSYDEEEGPHRPDETPGFYGQVRILGSLIWGDLYALLASQAATLDDFWPLVLDHPNQVYVGLTVPMQVHAWRQLNGTRGILMRELTEFAKARVEGEPWPVQSDPLSGGQNTTRSTDSPPNPFTNPIPGPLSAEEDALRGVMLSQFSHWLRQSGHHRQAAAAEELLRTPNGQEPDYDELMRRIEMEEDDPDAASRRPNRGPRRGGGGGGPPGGCPPQ